MPIDYRECPLASSPDKYNVPSGGKYSEDRKLLFAHFGTANLPGSQVRWYRNAPGPEVPSAPRHRYLPCRQSSSHPEEPLSRSLHIEESEDRREPRHALGEFHAGSEKTSELFALLWKSHTVT